MNKNIKRMTAAAVATAIIFIVTRIYIPIPGGVGYIHLGDSFVYLFACVIPFPFNIIVASLGGALSDLTGEFAIYALPTFIIKGVMAAMFNSNKKVFSPHNIIAILPASLVLVLGYFLTETFLYDKTLAISGLLFNGLQAAASGIIFVLLAVFLNNSKALEELKQSLR